MKCAACGANALGVRMVEDHYQFFVHTVKPSDDSARSIVNGCRVLIEPKTVEMWPRKVFDDVVRGAREGATPSPALAPRGPVEARR